MKIDPFSFYKLKSDDQATTQFPVWIDSDNALGSSSGDIDDALAIIAALRSGLSILAISSTFGNTSQVSSFKNIEKLLFLSRSDSIPIVAGPDKPLIQLQRSQSASDIESVVQLSQQTRPFRYVALGPLTHLALALEMNPKLTDVIEEVIFIGTNFPLNFPTWRFFDFNTSLDPLAALQVLEAPLKKITLVPLALARKLRFSRQDFAQLTGPESVYLKEGSIRWMRRAMLLKAQRTIPVWDLMAIRYLLHPKEFESTPVRLIQNRKPWVHLEKINYSTIFSLTKWTRS